MRILLQFPEGLKNKGLELAKKYEAEGHEVFLSAAPCYGACDLALDEARWIEADKIVHVGHNRYVMSNLSVPVEYLPYYVDVDIESLKALLTYIRDYQSIGLATTVQHVHQFEEMKAFFEKNGKRVITENSDRSLEKGQILGCDFSGIAKVRDKIDAVVFVGSGRFHSVAIHVNKPVFVFNVYDGSVVDVSADSEKLKKRRKGAIAKALTCKRFGILVSTKVGQLHIEQGQWAKKELEKRGFECAMLVANEFDAMSINNFTNLDCLVNTACPRLSDDQERFGKPLLNLEMLRDLFEIIDVNKD